MSPAASSGPTGQMTDDQDLAAIARAIVDGNDYMTLGTADADGLPWASPVWYAPAGYAEFLWLSSPEALHSRNLAVRAELSIVVFDSRVPIGAGQAVYMRARAEAVPDADLDGELEVFSRRSLARGGREWTRDSGWAARLNLYRAKVSEHWVLDPTAKPDRRTEVNLEEEAR
jgi:hypothetical protein